jgi:glycosyltransferase involved in cell wall biosynthesis
LGSKVSIITIILDNHRFVSDAINTVLAQTYKDIEYIVIDGDSKDGSLEIIRSYGDKIHVVLSEPDKGIYDAMNKGLALATGDIIGFLNSDDFYANNMIIADVVSTFNNPEVQAVYGDLDYVSLHNKTQIVRKWRSGEYNIERFYTGWMPPHPTFFARKSVYDQFGGYNAQLRSSADYELMLRMGLVHNVSMKYLPKVMVKMRMGGQSNRSFKNRLLAHLEDWKVWKLLGLTPRPYTLWLKPLQKLRQYWI